MNRLIAILLLAFFAGSADAQNPLPPIAPQSVVGNPNAFTAPAQAITIVTLGAALKAGNFIASTTPTTININSLPPQTVLGNAGTSAAAVSTITFSQLNSDLQPGGVANYTNYYDPTDVPAQTVIGNPTLLPATPIPISFAELYAFLNPAVAVACTNQLVLQYSNSCALIAQAFGE